MVDFHRKQSLQETCVICGIIFVPKNQVQQTCSVKCRKENAVRRTRTWRESHKILKPKILVCPTCKKRFTSTASAQKTCSNECAKKRMWGQQVQWRVDNKPRLRNRDLNKKFGISIEDYDVLYEKQKGKCLICDEYKPTLCIDHNHKTNKVRGLLCRKCNAAIGSLKDDPDLLNRAAEYLLASGGK